MNAKPFLPVDELLPEICSSLKLTPHLVLEAPPGAGKTTRVPPALLELVRGEIIVLEPRRIAARLAARRVAAELGEEVGGLVGYQVRFEEVSGPRTRLRFVTEGVLIRRLISDPELKGVDAVVLDEFHERHLEGDFALALLKRLRERRPELRIVVMSATLDAAPVARYLGECRIFRSEGRMFDVSIRHLPYSAKPLPTQVREAVEGVIKERHEGNILVFLPGIAEIRRTMRECESAAERAGILMLPLHGDLSPAEQDRAVSPSSQRKMIVATNVAESSLTVEGVTVVIDSGLARVSSYSPWSGLPILSIGRISRASAIQRAGRAGRTRAGRVVRLYPEEDFLRRPEHDTPEILRADLCQLCLVLRVMGIDHFGEVDWLDLPPEIAVKSAESLLDRLGASGKMAHQLAKYPLPPRVARLLVTAAESGVGEAGCVAAALLGSQISNEKNELLAAMELPQERHTIQLTEQLLRVARLPRGISRHDDDALLKSILTGFPDRVARRRSGSQVLLSAGGSAEIAGEPPSYEFMVAVDIEDRKEKPLPLIRMTSRIEPEWLIDLFPERVRDQSSVEWNRDAERVEAVSALFYDELVIQESRGGSPEVVAAADLLFRKALETGFERFLDEDGLNRFRARAEFAGFEVPDIQQVLRELCEGFRSFAELRTVSKELISLLEQQLGVKRLMDRAPEFIRLRNGRQTKIHYECGKPPWIASRLQDFFGMKETPRIGLEEIPVVIHLLAPNQRPVQMTTDLAGFWERLYPQVRRELMRRYPKHSWPEVP